ncbi:arylsulfotransferase family protein [Novosphingobium sp. 1949]|uniref:Arylsulfotransferase family protein n=1 Tax=Novosphingobium organovorum TaxID=2930092 RepID=A0ABT0BB63_9SPHN|nr:arylsulfotransferase family protein [Novosphingobium organovorum]MCJ2182115.1 arylsulfotransferase family protein [Novosphingobium organovorum]
MSALLVAGRRVVLFICALALFGWAVRQAPRDPDSLVFEGADTLARVPGLIGQTLANLVRDPFVESQTPDISPRTAHYAPIANHTAHRIEGLVLRTDLKRAAPQAGWRLVQGIFMIDGKPRYAALAISPRMAVERVWLVGSDMLVRHHFAVGQAPYPHGFALLDDGSMLYAFDSDYFPLRIDSCGKRVWYGDARITHAFNPDDTGKFAWGIGSEDDIRKIDLATGRTVRRITALQIEAANPQLSVFQMRRIDDNAVGANPRRDTERFYDDAFHINDAEPLPGALAAAFPEFSQGDLLISMRSLNLVLVIDPETLHVKWFTNDVTLRQHDPDWDADGTISVFDNQNGRSFSRIVAFDPSGEKAPHVLLDGQRYDFYSRVRGKHQRLPGGGLLVTSSEQGRAFEVDASGRLAWELVVHDPRHPGRNFVLSEVANFPSDSKRIERVLACPVS